MIKDFLGLIFVATLILADMVTGVSIVPVYELDFLTISESNVLTTLSLSFTFSFVDVMLPEAVRARETSNFLLKVIFPEKVLASFLLMK